MIGAPQSAPPPAPEGRPPVAREKRTTGSLDRSAGVAASIRRVELFAERDNVAALPFYRRLDVQVEGTLRDFYKGADEAGDVDEHVLGLLLVG